MLTVEVVELLHDSNSSLSDEHAWVRIIDQDTGKCIELRVDVNHGGFDVPWCAERDSNQNVLRRFSTHQFHSS